MDFMCVCMSEVWDRRKAAIHVLDMHGICIEFPYILIHNVRSRTLVVCIHVCVGVND